MLPETKILTALLLGLVGLELAMHPTEPRLSKDLAHLRGLGELAERFPAAGEHDEAESARGILVLGNSLARGAIDEAELRRGLGLGEDESVASMVPDATAVAEWAWGYRRYLLHREARPGRVLLVTGRTHLLDPLRPEVERLGAFFVGGSGDRQRFLREELEGFEARASFVLAGVSRLYANRGRVRPLLFYNAMPGYEEAVNRINAAAGGGHDAATEVIDPSAAAPEMVATAAARGPERLRHLRLLVDSVEASGAELIVVTAPLPESWALPSSVEDLLRERGVPVIALGEETPLPGERFPDGYHLDAEGAVEATRRLVEKLLGRREADFGLGEETRLVDEGGVW